MIPTKIFFDLDGVLADMIGAALRRLGFPSYFQWPTNVWNLETALAMSAEKIWGSLSDHDFWAKEITPTPECCGLVEMAERLVGKDDIYLVSKPTLSPFSASGKMTWIETHLPKYRRHYVLTPHKHLLARPDTVLVDDSPVNVSEFSTAGGHTVLVPRPWNPRFSEAPAKAVLELEELFFPIKKPAAKRARKRKVK